MSEQILQRAELAISAGERLAARTLLARLLSGEPGNVRALHLMSIIELSERNHAAARQRIEQILKVEPGHAAATQNLGVIAMHDGDQALAMSCFRQTLSVQPAHNGARYNLGQLLRSGGQHDDAVREFRKLTTGSPRFPAGWEALGETLLGLGQFDDALKACERAERHVKPSAHLLRIKGDALRRLGHLPKAVTAYRAALVQAPDSPDVLHNLARILHAQGDLEEALALHERQLKVCLSDTSHAALVERARCETIRLRLAVAKWDGLAELSADALKDARDTGVSLDPFLATLLTDDGDLIRMSARASWNATQPAPRALPSVRAPGRLRIGYLSADFHDHPVTHLMSRVFELHDRSRFDIFAYSAGLDIKSPYRKRVERAVEHFRDVRHGDDDEIADIIQRDDIDVLVDLMGHTGNNRLAVLRRRPARVTAHLIGFPGTMGDAAVDYFIADPVSLPAQLEGQFDEAIARLPGTYHPTDDALALPQATTTRQDHGLPTGAFVFAAFVQTSKLNPELMDVQARVLDAVPGSVLWLAEDKPATIARLRQEAERRGIDGQRLVFAPRVPYLDNLNRLTHADLVLDSWPYGGHTTTSNALWAGVPVLTRTGKSFASQAPSSLLVAADLPEMIAADTEHFVALAVRHGLERSYHDAIRLRLKAGRRRCRLFDTARFARELESAFTVMAARARAGERPASFVAPI